MTLLLALLLFAVPAAAFWTLVRALDPVGRLVVAIAASIVTVGGTAQIMLIAGAWSPAAGLVVILLVSVVVAVAGRLYDLRRRVAMRLPERPRPQGPPPAGVTRRDLPALRDEESEDWLYRD
jgi:hypothetical protein